ncbi:MAG: HD domain-containing phosphohydrolase [Terracidiphilus sp.]|jgi:putative nucleotidyltransferase with HDIG domain
MALRIKALVCLAVVGGIANLCAILGHPAQQWLRFFVYLAAILLSSGMKVGLPKSEGTMSLNFPFILLGILQLSPLQVVCLAVCSVIAQCRIQVIRPFTLIQILFNVANVTTATVFAWFGYEELLRLHCPLAPALAIAATIYFFSNTIPLALVIGWDQKIDPRALWRRDFLWFFPFYLVGAILAAAAYLIGVAFGWMTSLLLIPMVYTIYRTYSSQMAFVRDREQHAKDTEALHLRTIEGLAMAIEAKDENTHKHLLRVRVYVAELGKLMKLDESMMQALLIASYLHDIGKLAVPEYIINKPGKLTKEEFEKMKIHPVVGADILERVRFPYPVVPIVRSHHESWDGSGYPDGLVGEEIPIGARLLTAVDCFDALASERPYRRALPLEEAMAFVKARAGIQFDPRIVELLDENFLALEEKARQQIGTIEPLKTNITIVRGAAPGAGFEPAQSPSGMPSLTNAASHKAAVDELVTKLNHASSAHEMSSILSSQLPALVPHDGFAVHLRSGEFLLPQFIDSGSAKAFSMRQMALGEGLSGWVAEHARTIVNGNPTVEPNYLSDSAFFTATSSALSVPFFDSEGSVLGVITLYSVADAAFSKDHIGILEALESHLSQALQRALSFGIEGTKSTVPVATLAAS